MSRTVNEKVPLFSTFFSLYALFLINSQDKQVVTVVYQSIIFIQVSGSWHLSRILDTTCAIWELIYILFNKYYNISILLHM